MKAGTSEHMSADQFDPTTLASNLNKAWRAYRLIDSVSPGDRPRDLDEAYQVQGRFSELIKEPLCGYKIGLASENAVRWSGLGTPAFGWMSQSRVRANRSSQPLINSGKFMIEAEIAFVLGPHAAEKDALAEDLIAGSHLCLEIVRSRFVDWRSLDVLCFVADNLGFEGFVLGDRFDDTMGPSSLHLPIELFRNNQKVATSLEGADRTKPLTSFERFIAFARRSAWPLRPGMVVTTGNLVANYVTDLPGSYEARMRSAVAAVEIG